MQVRPYEPPFGATSNDENTGASYLTRLGIIPPVQQRKELQRTVPRRELAVFFARWIAVAAKRGIIFPAGDYRTPRFVDIKPETEIARAVQTITERGVYRSTSDRFHPEDSITYLELCRWLFHLLDNPYGASMPPDFMTGLRASGLSKRDIEAVQKAYYLTGVLSPRPAFLQSRDPLTALLSPCAYGDVIWSVKQVSEQVLHLRISNTRAPITHSREGR